MTWNISGETFCIGDPAARVWPRQQRAPPFVGRTSPAKLSCLSFQLSLVASPQSFNAGRQDGRNFLAKIAHRPLKSLD
jgi:hypothetical protein